jgi:hypothetical protein
MNMTFTTSHLKRDNLFQEDVYRELQEWKRCASP